MQRILGNSYGQLILENQWRSNSDSNDIFRFCYKDHRNPVRPRLKTADLNGISVAHQRSCRKVMFLVVSVCQLFSPHREVSSVQSPVPDAPNPVPLCSGHCTLIWSNLFNSDITLQTPKRHAHYEACLSF